MRVIVGAQEQDFTCKSLTPSLCNQVGEDPAIDLIRLPHGRVAQLPKSEFELVGRAAKCGVVIDVSRSNVRRKVRYDTGKTAGGPRSIVIAHVHVQERELVAYQTCLRGFAFAL